MLSKYGIYLKIFKQKGELTSSILIWILNQTPHQFQILDV
jgi:hypothetical protein